MLGRKQSIKLENMADYGNEELLNESTDIEWVNKVSVAKALSISIINFPHFNFQLWVRRLMRLCALVSLFSVCLNTPKTFERYPPLQYMTFISDITVGLLFTAEAIAKIALRGFLKGENPYLRDRWCQFDASMCFFLWTSVILQVLEISGVVPRFSSFSILRAPRPLVLIRFLRVFLKFSMPKSRINQIFK